MRVHVLTRKEVANIITSDLMGLIDTREKQETSNVTSIHLRDLADCVMLGKISRTSAKNTLYEIVKTGKSVNDVVNDLGLSGMPDDAELDVIVSNVISEEVNAVMQVKSNPKTINYLVGKVMKKTKGMADPGKTLELLTRKIDS